MRDQRTMSDELFAELIQQDEWIQAIALPVKCCTREGHFRHYCTCSYPTEYIVSEEQVRIAAEHYQRRHDEVLSNIKKGELVFRAMGCDYPSRFEGDVCNHRMRCYFKNSAGRTWFVELLRSAERWEKEKGEGFYYDFAHEVIDGKSHYEIHPPFPIYEYNGRKFLNRSICKLFTWENVLEEINTRFGCNYTSARLENYFVTCDEWVCEC